MDSVIHLLNNLGQMCKTVLSVRFFAAKSFAAFKKMRLEIKTVIGRPERCNK